MNKLAKRTIRLKAIELLEECKSRDCWKDRTSGGCWDKCEDCEVEIEFKRIRLYLKKK